MVLFSGAQLPYAHSFTTSATSPFGIWTGYVWQTEKTNASNTFNQLVAVCFGKTVTTNKLIVRVTYEEVEKGNVKGNLDLFGFLK